MPYTFPKPTDAEVEKARDWIKARGRHLFDAQNWDELGRNYVWNVAYLVAGYHKDLENVTTPTTTTTEAKQ